VALSLAARRKSTISFLQSGRTPNATDDRSAGPDGDGLARRVAAAEIQQQNALQVLGRPALAQSVQRARSGRQRFPARRKEARKEFPILVHASSLPETARCGTMHDRETMQKS